MTRFALSALILKLTISFFTSTGAANFDIQNRCSYTVWPAVSFGGGRRLDPGQNWQLNVEAGTIGATIWGWTGCNFDGSGRGSCETGDCRGLLQCPNPSSGQPPMTMAEFTLNGGNNMDYYDISVVDGFNIPMEFSPAASGCPTLRCLNGQCSDAYQSPNDDAKTKACAGGSDYRIVFCPTGARGSFQCYREL